jgi:thiamine-phosphate pyrophosphorylase
LWFNSGFEMKLVVISPEQDDPREIAVLGVLFAAGLERCHVRKPHWPAAQLETWLRAMPEDWRTRFVLHSNHELVAMLGLGGYHWRDEKGGAACLPAEALPALPRLGEVGAKAGPQDALSALRSKRSTFTSRSCHDLATLRAALGSYDSVFFGPVFPSISKAGYATELTVQVERVVPTRLMNNEDLNASGRRAPLDEISSLLNSRTANERRTTVLALGGVTAARLPQIRALGFDGVAVLGAVWQAADPVAAFYEMITACAGAACPAVAPYLQPNHAA